MPKVEKKDGKWMEAAEKPAEPKPADAPKRDAGTTNQPKK